jgi:hypothetical protein
MSRPMADIRPCGARHVIDDLIDSYLAEA